MDAATRRRRISRRTVMMVLVLVVLGGGSAFFVWRSHQGAPPELPAVSLADADPAVGRAVESAQDAVRRLPRSADAWGRLGMVLAAHAWYAEAATCFVEAERLDPSEARWPYFQGVVLTLGNPDAAIPHLRRASTPCSATTDAPRLRLAEVLLAQGQSAEAEELFRQVLDHDSANPRAHLGLGRLAYQRNDWPGALAHLGRAADSPLTRQRAHLLLAELHQRRGDSATAERERRAANDLPADPEAPDPLLEEWESLRVGKQAGLSRASRLLKQERAHEAVALLESLAREYPESASVWLGLGRGLVQQERYAAAEKALRQAERLDGERVEVQFYLGVVLFQEGNPRSASACFRRAAELRPDYALAHYNLGQCLKALSDRSGALAAFRAAIRYRPHHVQAHIDLAELLAAEGDRSWLCTTCARLSSSSPVSDGLGPFCVNTSANSSHQA